MTDSVADRARRYIEGHGLEAPRAMHAQMSTPSRAANPMERCFRCGKPIRKADIVFRLCCSNGLFVKVKLHDACTSDHRFFDLTPELESIAGYLAEKRSQDAEREEKRRSDDSVRASELKAREDDTAMYVCRLELETDRHDDRPCRAPQCPVLPRFTWMAPGAYAYARWKDRSGHYVCTMCGDIAQKEHNRDECHRCSDWGGCGNDCTLSAVRCMRCGTRMPV